MTLSERIEAATRCTVEDCERHREPDSLVCREDMTLLWRNLLERKPDGTYRRCRFLRARDLTGQVVAA